MCPFKCLGLESNQLDLRTFVANSALSRVRAILGALLAKIWGRGALNHFNGPGSIIPFLILRRKHFPRVDVGSCCQRPHLCYMLHRHIQVVITIFTEYYSGDHNHFRAVITIYLFARHTHNNPSLIFNISQTRVQPATNLAAIHR